MLKKMLLVSLLMSSFETLKADALNAIPPPDHETQVSINQKAPFSGVLLDIDQYRYYRVTEIERDDLARAAAQPQTSSFGSYALMFLGGLAIGALAGASLGK